MIKLDIDRDGNVMSDGKRVAQAGETETKMGQILRDNNTVVVTDGVSEPYEGITFFLQAVYLGELQGDYRAYDPYEWAKECAIAQED